MATYYVSNPGNLAIQQEVWSLTLDEAKRAGSMLESSEGSYWYTTLLRPYRRAKRAKAATVRVYTAGFSTGELSNVLYATGSTVTQRATY